MIECYWYSAPVARTAFFRPIIYCSPPVALRSLVLAVEFRHSIIDFEIDGFFSNLAFDRFHLFIFVLRSHVFCDFCSTLAVHNRINRRNVNTGNRNSWE